MARVLVVEDHAEMGALVTLLLSESGHESELATTLAAAEKLLAKKHFDLVTLDVNLPDGSGFEYCAKLRKRGLGTPIILLTSEVSAESVVEGFSRGASDYLKKPIDPKELEARLRAHLNQVSKEERVLEFKHLKLDLDTKAAQFKGRKIELSLRQFEILALLVRRPEAVLTRAQIIDELDRDLEIYDRTIDSHMSQLRKRLKDSGVTQILISSIYGAGYRIE